MNYLNITYPDMNNGDGLRVVLWVAGCSHHCYNCQNPTTWDCHSGISFEHMEVDEIYNELSKDYISGITFSGGDPLNENNRDTIYNLILNIRTLFPTKTIWIYTGYTWDEIVANNELFKIVKESDVLVDGRYVEALRDINLYWRGSSNQRVIDVKKSLQENKIVLHCD